MSVLISCCPICKTTNKLLLCQGCKVMSYCCREHQIADRNNHKAACNAVKKSRTNLEREEKTLREPPPDMFLPENVFESSVGHFWGILETRDYMRARYALADKLIKIKTYAAVKCGFDHVMDMFRLCRSDYMGLRFMVPALFLRLGNDQQCYDFMKWHRTTGGSGDYDWGDMDLPFLDVRDANVFESVNGFTDRNAHVEFAVALMLIKMKLLKDITSLQNSNFMYDEERKLPAEIVDRIRKEAVRKIVTKRKDILMNVDQKELIVNLEKQLQKLFAFVDKSNKYIWPGLLNPGAYLAATPTGCSYGSKEHALLIIQFYYDAFVETPGSTEMIRRMVQKNGLH